MHQLHQRAAAAALPARRLRRHARRLRGGGRAARLHRAAAAAAGQRRVRQHAAGATLPAAHRGTPSTSLHLPPPPPISLHLLSFPSTSHCLSTSPTPLFPFPSTLHLPPSPFVSLSDLPARSRGAPKGRRRPVAAAGRLRPRAHRRQVLRVGARERGGRAVTAAALPDRISAALVRGVRHPPLL